MERNGTSGVWTVLCTFEIIYLSLRGSRKRELPAVVLQVAIWQCILKIGKISLEN